MNYFIYASPRTLHVFAVHRVMLILLQTADCVSLLRRGSSVRYINPLCEVYRRRKVEWIDLAENLCQMYVDFSYIDGFLDFG